MTIRGRSAVVRVAHSINGDECLLVGAFKAVVSEDPELLANGGTVLSREEQETWFAVQRWLREQARGPV